ncbi:hypothetical protein M0657_005177 [Pyricularia oryzae]|nr:hypothetical protein M9X92_010613 [Pyricularia oryzae]KAI7923445.1 hypothetical protein M0657_005177 [Pyricularia oryzae]
MDIHRCRFVPYPTSAINTLSFNRPYIGPGEKSQKSIPVRLAVGRENGDIEIWNPLDGVWHQETIIHGGVGRKTDALVWATEPDVPLAEGGVAFGKSRLFSIGGRATVTEWDLAKARPKAHASGQHGDIWCLGLQPAPEGQSSSRLVAGTGDGCLVLYSIEDEELRLQRVLVKNPLKKVHFVSIAFQSRHVVVVGCSDGSIRIFNTRNGSEIRKMTLGRDLIGGAKDVIVWCVKVLANGDIVSGDSTGQVCIWDGKTYTQAQRIQSHSQDVLSLAVSADGTAIFSGGMDRKTILYKRLGGHNSTRWSKVFHRRYHSHDVKALAAFEGRGMSVVVSGGSDASPIVIPLREAGLENHRQLSHLPQSTPLVSAPKARLAFSWWGREIHIWKVPERSSDSTGDVDSDGVKPPRTLKRMLIKGSSDIVSAAISDDGALLAVSTVAEIKLFRLSVEKQGLNEDKDELTVTRVVLPETIANLGASLVQVSPDGKWMCLVREGSEVSILRVDIDGSQNQLQLVTTPKPQKLRRFKREAISHSLHFGLGGYPRQITHAAFAPDSEMLATADLSGFIDTWVLNSDGTKTASNQDDASSSSDESDDDEETTTANVGSWIRNPKGALIPKLPSAVTVLSFSNTVPSSPDIDYELLAVTTASWVFVFHPSIGTLTPWTRRHPYGKLPEAFRANRDLIKGALWQGSRIWLYGASSLFMLDMTHDLSTPQAGGSQDLKPGTKRKRDVHFSGAGNRMGIGALDSVKIQKTTGATGEWIDLELEDASNGRRQPDDDDDESDGGELQSLRAAEEDDDEEAGKTKAASAGWWHTYKYRPILGAVPLKPSGEQDQGQLEVVLVERPLWESLPARYADDERGDRAARDYP